MVSRTALTATASIVGVLVAGTAAVGANIGILNAADSSEVGQLSAAVAPTTNDPVGVDVVDVYVDDLDALLSPTSLPGSTVDGPKSDDDQGDDESSTYEAFTVDAAGEIVVENYGDRIEVESVTPTTGYTSTVSETSPRALTVTFDGPTVLVFQAVLNVDGTISASVEAPVVIEVPAPTSAPTPSAAPSYDDEDEDDEYDDHDDDHEDDDHEDDDDHDEYEGADDDD
ncbi:MAG: hypothetical protein RIB98_05375 [Acidimicrobiales bacterium]